jgi:hypothetical protein
MSAAKRRTRPPKPDERRANLDLREVLDELTDHVRMIARTVMTMSQEELEYAQQRLEWLADEVWRIVMEK